MFNLNDIRFFVAVAETGSLSGAARNLGVTQPTVGRRIHDMERALGATLFARSLSGYDITSAGIEILDAAKSIEQSAWSISNRVAGDAHLHQGRVCVTVTEGLGIHCMPKLLQEFQCRHPQIQLDLLVRNTFLDLLRRQADVAVRLGKPGSDDLVGRVLCAVNFGLYASAAYIDTMGVPESVSDLHKHCIIAPTGDLAKTRQAKMLAALLPDHRYQLSTNNIVAQLTYVQSGMGIAPLPGYLASPKDGLVRVLKDKFDFDLDLWLLTHKDLRNNDQVRLVREFLSQSLLHV